MTGPGSRARPAHPWVPRASSWRSAYPKDSGDHRARQRFPAKQRGTHFFWLVDIPRNFLIHSEPMNSATREEWLKDGWYAD